MTYLNATVLPRHLSSLLIETHEAACLHVNPYRHESYIYCSHQHLSSFRYRLMQHPHILKSIAHTVCISYVPICEPLCLVDLRVAVNRAQLNHDGKREDMLRGFLLPFWLAKPIACGTHTVHNVSIGLCGFKSMWV